METIELENGKYILSHENGLNFVCNRNGEPTWRNLQGDGMVMAMFQRIQDLEAEVTIMHEQRTYELELSEEW